MRERWLELVQVFLKLGLTSFGGPIAHLGYYRAECVAKRQWLTEEAFAELVALCQFLPGPSSSQVVFALGMLRGGWIGALLASFCFLFPSALLMTLFAYGVRALSSLQNAGWLHGLKLCAVAVVAQAVWSMGVKLCPDRERFTLCVVGASVLLFFPGALVQLGVLAAGALVGIGRFSSNDTAEEEQANHTFAPPWSSVLALVLFGVFLLLPQLFVSTSVAWVRFDAFYRAGTLVFGGGHVVLPLLREALVPKGYLDDSVFLAGYGAAQALPGPLFSFAAFLGTSMEHGAHAWKGGLLALLAIFLPGWLLVAGALPFWHRLRAKRWVQAALKGTNATVVGVLLAALYAPVFTEAVHKPKDMTLVLLAFLLLEVWKAPVVAVVGASALCGALLL